MGEEEFSPELAVGTAGLAVMEAAPDALVIVDSRGRIVLMNAQSERMFGFGREELIGQPIERLVPERFANRHLEQRDPYIRDPRTREMGIGLELFARRKDGSEFPVEISLSPLKTDAGTLVSAAVRDVTERKRAEQLFRGLLEAAPDGMVIVDRKGNIVLLNAQSERLFGYSRDELIGQPIERLVPDRFTASHSTHRAFYTEDPHTREMGIGLDLFARRKDGSEFPVEISLSPLQTESGTLVSAAVRDVTERRRVKQEAERANQAKSDFLSRMSHELRTPLNAILGFGQLLELESLKPQQEDSLKQIMRAGRHLLDLIDEVLDISRIEAGRLPVSPEPVRVANAVSEAIQLVQPAASERQVTFEGGGRVHGDWYVLADRQRLRQVLLNLLSNAVKYNRPGGTVEVKLNPIGERRLRISVLDTGPGIPDHFFDRLFQPFERLGASESGVQGTGLGLALSKGLIEAMGGSMHASSKWGEGSTFSVELPWVEAPVVAFEQIKEDLPMRQGTEQQTRTLLYIEDNLSNLRLIERVLELRPGYELLSAMQASLGLELAETHRPDVILLDLHLPDMRGEEALLRLQQQEATRGIPVVIISADATPGQIQRLIGSGATAYLTKPLNVRRFLELIDDTLEIRHKES
jgi:PAS domain S-box-containing protein